MGAFDSSGGDCGHRPGKILEERLRESPGLRIVEFQREVVEKDPIIPTEHPRSFFSRKSRPILTERVELVIEAELGHNEGVIFDNLYLFQRTWVPNAKPTEIPFLEPPQYVYSISRVIRYCNAKNPNPILENEEYWRCVLYESFNSAPYTIILKQPLCFNPPLLEPSIVFAVCGEGEGPLKGQQELIERIEQEVNGIQRFVQYCSFFSGGEESAYNTACSLVRENIEAKLRAYQPEVGCIRAPNSIRYPSLSQAGAISRDIEERLKELGIQNNRGVWRIPFELKPILLENGLSLKVGDGEAYVALPGPRVLGLGFPTVRIEVVTPGMENIAEGINSIFKRHSIYPNLRIPIDIVPRVVGLVQDLSNGFRVLQDYVNSYQKD